MSTDADLRGKTAVVTGASSGIGRAVAQRLGLVGALVYLIGRTAEPMQESRTIIERSGGKAEVVELDVRDSAAFATAIDRAALESGRLDIVVNNAGLGYPGPILNGEREQWREMLDVNVLAVLVGAQAAVRAMRRAGNGGHIINISSTGALRPDSGVYGSTKYAVNYLTQGMRQELEDEDIRVSTVAPGVVATNFVRHFDPQVVKSMTEMLGLDLNLGPGDRWPDAALEQAQTTLENSVAQPDDIADAVLYLVGLPLRLNIDDIIVRPAKQLDF